MGFVIDALKSFSKTLSKLSRPYFSIEENELKFKIDSENFYKFPITNIETKTRHDSYVLEAYTLSADNLYIEYIHTPSDISWNGQALSFYKDLFKDSLKIKSLDLIEKREFSHYEFLVYKIDYKFIVNVIYIYEINKDIFIIDIKGELYENLLKIFDKTYEYRFEKNPIDYKNLNFSLVKNNAMKSYFNFQSGD